MMLALFSHSHSRPTSGAWNGPTRYKEPTRWNACSQLYITLTFSVANLRQAPRLSFQFTTGNGTRAMSFGGPTTQELSGPGGANRPVPTLSEYVHNSIFRTANSRSHSKVPPRTARWCGRSATDIHRTYASLSTRYASRRRPCCKSTSRTRWDSREWKDGRLCIQSRRHVPFQQLHCIVLTDHPVIALDEIITQIMENSNAHRPVPATDEIIDKLPREVLTVGCMCFSALKPLFMMTPVSCHSKRRLRCVQGSIQT